jgi:hypothetical protein
LEYGLMESVDSKLKKHVGDQVKRKEPGIFRLVKSYNDLCTDIETLVRKGEAPVDAIIPQKIDRGGLFKLDVDDNIWQDTGLDEELEGPVPLWLGDEGVRGGIKAMLLLDRCLEDEKRLITERCALQEWMMDEWACVQSCIQAAGAFIHLQYDMVYLAHDMKLNSKILTSSINYFVEPSI